MNYRTLILSNFEEYLAEGDYSPEVRAEEERERNGRLSQFPHTVMLQASYPEIDFANRWCWQQFGPYDGECLDRQSEYRSCGLNDPHSHVGKWMWRFLQKTDYDFGFAEWYFESRHDQECFLANSDALNWGENYPR